MTANTTLLILAVVLVILPAQTLAFGAGDIPGFSYLENKAFRHGDIENILAELTKQAGNAAVGGGLLGFAKHVVSQASGGSRFSTSDIKKIYFGNWLRDYSQAMDIAGLSKLSADTLVLVVAILGFMTFGFATEEFEVTADRLGVYLPTEHIDNPRGYAAKEGDARQWHKKLRGPVNDRELEIDERTGMKKYMATEGEEWDTSTGLLRRVFRECIEKGRRANGQEGAELWEAYRLLGTGLHTLEDLLAHSNWCEIALRKMGHSEIFCHVGDDTDIDTPNGRAPPLVTGTFGGADFLHSLLGEASDKLSQASVTALQDKISAQGSGGNELSTLKDVIGKFGGGAGEDKLDQGEQIHNAAQGYNFDPDNVAPPEVQKQLLDLLKWHDQVFRDVQKKLEMVPGLGSLLEELTEALNKYVYTAIGPYVTPLLSQVTQVLGEGSKTVIDSDDQYEVFDNSRASDPSHSMLSKDHFALLLNEPAGLIAQQIVIHTVKAVVNAWGDDSNPDDTINRILEAFHHPYYATGRSDIQDKMFRTMEHWLTGLDDREGALRSLTKESVREHKNKRPGENNYDEPGYHSHGHGAPTQRTQSTTGNRQSGNTYGGQGGHGQSESRQQASFGGGRNDNANSYGRKDESSGYGGRTEQSTHGTHSGYQPSYGGAGREEQPTTTGYGGNDYGDHGRTGQSGYGTQSSYQPSYGGRRQEQTSSGGYGRGNDSGDRTTHSQGRREETHNTYGGRTEDSSYSSTTTQQYSYGDYNRRDNDNSSHKNDNESHGYGGRRDDDHSRNNDNDNNTYGRRHEQESHSSGRRGDDDDHSRRGGRQDDDNHSRRGGRGDEDNSHGRRDNDHGYAAHRDRDDDNSYGHSGRRDHDSDTFGAERLNIDDNEYGGGRRNREREHNDY